MPSVTAASSPSRFDRARDRLALLVPTSVAKLMHWEFWPTWAAYAPLVPVYFWLAAKHRSWTLPLIANTCGPLARLAGESKQEILDLMPGGSVTRSFRLDPRGTDTVALAMSSIRERGWSFPLIVKPDRGCRGSGVRLARDESGLAKAIAGAGGDHSEAVLVQPFHPGPREAGVFYVRNPKSEAGGIFSVTVKDFAVVVGDGRATIAELIASDPRKRLQRERFLARLGDGASRVPPAGERVPVCLAGNHCQGTMFLDGTHLITPELVVAVDEIARAIPGFHFGRFDIRYSSDAELRKGEGFIVIELNGITSESTNVYDPSMSIARAYRTLSGWLSAAFEIGAANRARGVRPPSLRQAARLVRDALREPNRNELSD